MYNTGFDEMFFVSQFLKGLKYDLRGAVQSQLPDLWIEQLCLLECSSRFCLEVNLNFRITHLVLGVQERKIPNRFQLGVVCGRNNNCVIIGGLMVFVIIVETN